MEQPILDDANLWLPSAVGAARPTYLAPTAQMAGNLANKDPILVVGFHGMRDFYPQLIAENLNRQGYTTRAAFLPLDTITSRTDSNTVQLAHALDDRARQQTLATSLRKLAHQRGTCWSAGHTRCRFSCGIPGHSSASSWRTNFRDSDTSTERTRYPPAPVHRAPAAGTMDVRVEIGMDAHRLLCARQADPVGGDRNQFSPPETSSGQFSPGHRGRSRRRF